MASDHDIPASTSEKDGDAKLPQYADELRSLYKSLTATKTSENQWPPSCTHRVFNLALVKEEEVRREQTKNQFVRMTITGKLDDIMRVKHPVTLEDIFKGVEKGKRRVVLIEGAPGCGKSTLSIHISQQWSEGELFKEYKVVVLVRLRDPVVQKAESILDLIPTSQLESVAKLAEQEMRASQFQDVLFILDGWDELPKWVHENPKSIFRSLIQEDIAKENGLHKSAVIVTSRPVASGDLQKMVSARVEVLGFTPDELTDYFRDCLEDDEEAVRTLQERIEEIPAIAGTCYLPLNASVLVHLFKYGRRANLPTSQYGVFSLLVCTCIQRHLKERTQLKGLTFESLEQLTETEGVSEPFKFLCELAYDGVMNDRITFSSLSDDVNTLSLLQGVESFLRHTEKVKSYNFIHLSIQELLAAFYMVKWLLASEQVNNFNELFNNPRFNAVFKFYSAITKLQTPGIIEIITKVAKQCSDEDPDDEAKVLLVALFHCLAEADDPSLCEVIMEYLQEDGLNLGHMTLNQTDCLSIGYFLSYACSTKSSINLFKANLFNSYIGDRGIKYLVKGILKYLDSTGEATNSVLHLNLRWNGIHEEGSIELCRLIKLGCLKALVLNGNDEFSDDGARHIGHALDKNTTLKELSLYTCGLKPEGLGYIAQGLKENNTLTMLNVGGNGLLDEGIEHLAHTLKDNKGLQSLNLSSSGMTDIGFRAIADSLQKNDTLTELKLFNFQNQPHLNELSDTDGTLKYLTESLRENTTLLTLSLPADFESFASKMQDSINETRTKIKEITVKADGKTLAFIRGKEEPVEEENTKEEMMSAEEEGESCSEFSETSSADLFSFLFDSNPRSDESDFSNEALQTEEEDMEMETERDYPSPVEQLSPTPLEVEEEEPFAMATQAESTMAQPIDTDLRGVEVCAKTTVVVTNRQQSFIWKGYGLRLYFQEGCLPKGIEECVLNLEASIAGEYEFPERHSLVSAVYWLRPEPQCRFARPISVEIQHCAKQENYSKLGFVKALCSQQDLPYSFRRLSQHGCFYRSDSDNKSYGVLELNSFSAIGVAQEGSEERDYAAKVFYLRLLGTNCISYEIHLVVTWNDESHLSSVDKKYCAEDHPNKKITNGPEQEVEFESTEIKIDLPEDGTKLEEGWMLRPMITPVIQKKKVDSYKPGKMIPKFQLMAHFTNIKEKGVAVDTSSFQYRVKLIGTKEPNMFLIHINPPNPVIKKNKLKRQSAMKDRSRFAKRKFKSNSMETKESSDKILCGKKSHSFSELDSKGGVSSKTKKGNKPANSDRDEERRKRKKRKRTQSSSAAARVPKHVAVDLEELIGEISKHVGKKWKLLARELEFEKTDIDAIEYKDERNLKEQIYQMFHQWKKREGQKATTNRLLKAVKKAKLHELLKVLREKRITLPSGKERRLKWALSDDRDDRHGVLTEESEEEETRIQKTRKRPLSSSTVAGGKARKTARVSQSAITDDREERDGVLTDDREERDGVLTEESEEEETVNGGPGRNGHIEATLNETTTNSVQSLSTTSGDADVESRQQKLAKPTPKNLVLMKWKNSDGEEKEFRAKQSMCMKWRDIGELLEIDGNLLDIWEKKYHRDPQDCINPVLSHWRESPTHEYPFSWQGLLSLLKNVELTEAAKELKQVLQSINQ